MSSSKGKGAQMQNQFRIMVMGACLAGSAVNAADGGVSTVGKCVIKVPRNRFSLTFSAVHESKSSQEAHQKVQTKYEAFRKAVVALKLKDVSLQTTTVSLNPRVQWIDNKNVLTGYEGRASLEITSSAMDRVSELYTQAGQAGIQEFGALRMFVAEKEFDEAYQSCLKSAVEDARAKAEQIAQAAKRSLGQLSGAIEMKAGSLPMPLGESARGGGMMAKAMMQDSGAIEAGQGGVGVEVVATFELK